MSDLRLRHGVPLDPMPRRLAAMQLINNLGNGLSLVVLPLFLHRVLGLSTPLVAGVLSVGAVAGMAGSLLLGRVGDRVGLALVLRVSAVVAGLAMGVIGALPVEPGGSALVAGSVCSAAIAVQSFADRGLSVSRNALIAEIAGPIRVPLRAYLRSVLNVGFSLGIGGAALVGLSAEPGVWRAAVLFDACTFVAVAVLARGLPAQTPTAPTQQVEAAAGHDVLRDLPYLSTTAALALFVSHFDVFTLALTLWLVADQGAPVWVASLALVVNTVVATLGQVRAARGIDSVPSAGRAIARSAGWVGAGFAVLAAAGPAPGLVWLAGLAVLAAALHVVGDMRSSAAQWELEMGLAPAGRQGEYLGAAAVLVGAGRALAPPLVAVLLVGGGVWGFAALISLYAGTAVLVPRLARWAASSKARCPVA